MCNPILTLDEAQSLAAKLAKNTHEPAHVVRDGMLLRIATDADIACWQLRDVVWSVEPEQVYEQPFCTTCGNDGDCPDCDALTTSIITTMVRSGLSVDTPPPGFPDDDDGTEDGGGPPNRAPSLYALIVAECQAELDAGLAQVA